MAYQAAAARLPPIDTGAWVFHVCCRDVPDAHGSRRVGARLPCPPLRVTGGTGLRYVWCATVGPRAPPLVNL
ncbi:hypothetical protein [Komagataeibacter swingsii]|uniref:hypothetical protein n=1 Tax=Komagataeibacter swingsii TaxID=215220 RepID=UPI0011B745DC|nr:hypothetical protein [Komagataeibacter swingsii]